MFLLKDIRRKSKIAIARRPERKIDNPQTHSAHWKSLVFGCTGGVLAGIFGMSGSPPIVGGLASSSDYILVLLSPASVESKWVRQEIDLALSRELADRAIRLIPILIADCDIPEILRSRLYLDLRQTGKPACST